MTIKMLDTVVLKKDIPDHGLKKGDLGAVVEMYDPDGIEVEFVLGSGKTRALLTLHTNDVRTMKESDVLSVRSEDAASVACTVRTVSINYPYATIPKGKDTRRHILFRLLILYLGTTSKPCGLCIAIALPPGFRKKRSTQATIYFLVCISLPYNDAAKKNNSN